jgi:hypothetical protein
MKHSNQERELILSDQGTLAEVYTAGGDVLMGTARWPVQISTFADSWIHLTKNQPRTAEDEGRSISRQATAGD